MSIIKNEIYNYLLKIPKGKVVTYLQIATFLRNKRLCRVVGNVLHNNPDKMKYPCYKVVRSNGCLSNNYAFDGIEIKKKYPESENIKVIKYKAI